MSSRQCRPVREGEGVVSVCLWRSRWVSPPHGAGRHCDEEDWRQVVSIVRVAAQATSLSGATGPKRLAGREVCPGKLL